MEAAEAIVFRPPRRLGVTVGAAGSLAAWAVAALAALAGFRGGASLAWSDLLAYLCAASLAGAGALLAFWSLRCLRLAYVIERGALTIPWGSGSIVIPLGGVQRLIPGELLSPPRVRGLVWPGCQVGRGRVEGLGEVLFLSTHRRLGQLLYLVTPHRSYAISHRDPRALTAKLQERLGPRGAAGEPRWRAAARAPGLPRKVALPIFFRGDARAQRLALLAVLLAAGLFPLGALSASVPREIPWTALALAGANLILAYVLYPWDRGVAWLLVLGAVGFQGLAWAAAALALA